jgi:hypothetical protein
MKNDLGCSPAQDMHLIDASGLEITLFKRQVALGIPVQASKACSAVVAALTPHGWSAATRSLDRRCSKENSP